MPIVPLQTSPYSGFQQLFHPDAEAIRNEIAGGLLAPRPHVSPKFFYDPLGSRLFEAICELPEYYLTRTEAVIVEEHLQEIAAAAGQGNTLIDLGAGNCAKAARLLPALQPTQYVPIDISIDFLRDAVADLQHRFPEIPMFGIGMDFSTSLALPPEVHRNDRLFFYPGSSIGNFAPADAATLLQRIHAACDASGAVLIGVDLVKESSELEAAYDDALGVTAAFNLNLLLHLNRLLGANFRLRDWRHRSFYNAREQRVEMHLEARHNALVRWPGGERQFAEGERIHTESSYKYTKEGFAALLQRAGFGSLHFWSDERHRFLLCHARAM